MEEENERNADCRNQKSKLRALVLSGSCVHHKCCRASELVMQHKACDRTDERKEKRTASNKGLIGSDHRSPASIIARGR